MRDIKDRLMGKVEMVTESGCWIWMGALRDKRKPKFDYGVIKIRGKYHPANRVFFELFSGPIPEGKFVCHTCDVPLCVNPSHLFVGTHTENMRDMVKKGRNRHGTKTPFVNGEKNPSAKLSYEQVNQIRSTDGSSRFVGKVFGVSKDTICSIRNGETWR